MLWVKRFFFSQHRFIRFTPLVSILSLILASSSLVLAMSVYSGYETTVKEAIVNMTGHLVITGRKITTQQDIIDKIKEDLESTLSYSPFLSLKSLLVYKGQLSGVLLDGIASNESQHRGGLKSRLIKGTFDLKDEKAALIGRGVAKKFNLNPRDYFYIVLPKMNPDGSFQNKHQQLYVEGILDMGFHGFNSRYILINIKTARSLIHHPTAVTGLRFLIRKESQTERMRVKWANQLGSDYKVRDWKNIIKSINSSYFEAVQREKFLIFFILMVLVLASAFNVSSHLSITVLNQIREICILKVMGASSFFIFFLILTQGFIVSFVGTVIG
ncbi:MAG: hypothetical protein OXH36_00150, partial [Bdellovibrionales bacterium]|nr:hypothetical protein [Bdellovibrionales bacterium]